MRIISGTHKGRRIEPPTNLKARPTTDFAKEGLFNILNNITEIEGVDTLDLFSGSGSISYEFASRGAASVTSIEMNRIHANFIKSTATKLGFSNIRQMQADVFAFINSCGAQYDLIFADPPYALKEIPTIPDLILNKGMLKEGGLLVLEHGRDNNFANHPRYVDERCYGSVHFSFFR